MKRADHWQWEMYGFSQVPPMHLMFSEFICRRTQQELLDSIPSWAIALYREQKQPLVLDHYYGHDSWGYQYIDRYEYSTKTGILEFSHSYRLETRWDVNLKILLLVLGYSALALLVLYILYLLWYQVWATSKDPLLSFQLGSLISW